MLAQVGRPGLVRDLAARLIAEFADNLDSRLSGTSSGDAVPVELNGMSLVFGLLRARVARWFGRFSSSKDGAA
jgi:carbon-monoxide dehydrogenase small subunit